MGLQTEIARIGGDVSAHREVLAVWPWPAVIVGNHRTKFDFRDYRAFTAKLLPGDMVLTTSAAYFLVNRGIECTAFKHLAVVTGAVSGEFDGDSKFIAKPRFLGLGYRHTGSPAPGVFERTVTHAISEGVVCQDLGELLFHADYALTVRPWRSDEARRAIVDAALSQVGVGYNFDFTPKGPKAFYCTELGVHCLRKAGLLLPEKIRLTVDWRGFVLPLGRFKSEVTVADAFAKEFDAVVASVSCADPAFAAPSRWRDIVRSRLLKAPDALSL